MPLTALESPSIIEIWCRLRAVLLPIGDFRSICFGPTVNSLWSTAAARRTSSVTHPQRITRFIRFMAKSLRGQVRCFTRLGLLLLLELRSGEQGSPGTHCSICRFFLDVIRPRGAPRTQQQADLEKKARSKVFLALMNRCRAARFPQGDLLTATRGSLTMAVLDAARSRGVPQKQLWEFFLRCTPGSRVLNSQAQRVNCAKKDVNF